MQYKRILLKLSGEALMGDRQYGIDPERLKDYAEEIKSVVDQGVEVAVVIGGGNIFRGVAGASKGMTVFRVTTWACWQQSSMVLLYKVLVKMQVWKLAFNLP